VFPVYVLVLKICLWVLVPVFALIVAPLAVVTATHPSKELVKTLWDLAMSAVFTLGVVTAVFAVIERYPVEYKAWEKWDPRQLPRIPKVEPDGRPTPRVTAIAELAAGLIVSWLFVTWFRTTFDLGGVRITLAPIWRAIYWPSLLVLLAGVPLGWVSLIWPARTRLRSGIRLTIHGMTLVIVGVLLRVTTWVEIAAPQFPTVGIEQAAKWANFGIWIALVVMAIITIADAFQDARRIFRRKTARTLITSSIVGH
jgi:hypothetical protein